MRHNSRARGLLLAAALAATIAACLYPVEEEVLPVVRQARANAQPAAAAPAPAIGAPAEGIAQEPDPEAANVDPFAPRGWQAPPIAPPAPATVTPVAVAPVVVEPQGPPPLPFQYLGRLSDGEAPLVYLVRGEQTLVAKPGETLDQTYRVVNVGPQQIEFLHLPTGEAQTMSLPAPDR